jgi:hypothetical protein
VKSKTCDACCQRGGELNGNWKGGRTRHKAGYLMVSVPDHPRAPSNLELWVRPQPSGIRASDALAWALEIIWRYEGLAHLQQGSDE